MIATLLVAAAAAGWVDAVVGGGGLLLLPAMMLAAPQLPTATALGTNKLTAICGTSTAAVTYARRTKIDWRVAGPSAGLALLCSGCGALLAARIPAAAFRPLIIAVLVAVAVFVTVRPQMGMMEHPQKRTRWRRGVAVAVAGGAIATYDGLIGPGTGTFLVLAFTGIVGADFVHASAMAKIVNTATNLGALVVFAATGHVAWKLGLGMAVCNVLGSVVGARMALRRGAGFVRIVLLVVVLALIVRLGYLYWQEH
ncbi:sulfite exporter TauE/SafE family protein [Actinoplanes flavus]|uniref:Probable membrane transporter protein n=1 Tax=Actinoplanes flavus TaxID=2820290 RepID=A0ABS3UIG0_9ACTN|nr:TSUP family transporter [Actinoplanes flavus]MBO3738562.1 sulfite exporter TauE/SafE family protein [Actinoplanes flavus]